MGTPRREPTSATGSVESFEVFFRRVLPRAVAAAQRVTGERASAEDAAVEALTKAHLRWPYLAGEEWRDLWVVRVSVNEAIRHLPRPARPVTAPAGADLAETVANREMLGWSLAALPRRQREVIVLRHLMGLSEVEVAMALEISHGTVKTHLRRGLAVLRLRLEADRKEGDLAALF
jgi:RNA polymerase sigma factor (sigma-70 family)